jgi:hypothetical protein
MLRQFASVSFSCDLGDLSTQRFWEQYQQELERMLKAPA